MTEIKLFRVVTLTLIVYGCISFLQWGKFVVPLPAFELVILGISVYFAIVGWKTDKRASILFLLFGAAQFLSRTYNYELFLSSPVIPGHAATIIFDVMLIISTVFLSLLFLQQYIRAKNKKGMRLLIGLLILICGLVPFTIIMLLPLAASTLLFLIDKNLFEKQHSIWAFLLLFAVSRELTLALL